LDEESGCRSKNYATLVRSSVLSAMTTAPFSTKLFYLIPY
jgi:hypothetical protein